jgi:hypothetical protein
MADVLNRTEYERLFGSIDAALEAYKSYDGPLTPLDQEVFIELRSLRMWLLSILRVTANREPAETNSRQLPAPTFTLPVRGMR